MQRFSFSHLTLGNNLHINDDAFIHQISRVLRSTTNENITLFNGDGWEYIYTIQAITKKEIGLSFVEKYKNTHEPTVQLRLYQALPNKYEKIEYILQKGVEIGIHEFIFFRSERSQNLIINDRKIERFNDIVREATEQCGGNYIPSIIFDVDTLPSPDNTEISYALHTEESGSKNIRDITIPLNSLSLFIGPEGGWSEKEIDIFRKRNIELLHLGNRILRTETAGIVASFFLMMR